MPITKSAKKALRQSKTRRTRNLARTNAYKTAIKQFRKTIAAGDTKAASALLSKVYQTVDKAAKQGIIKANKAARLKSAVMRAVSSTA
ncbi:MAG TPA: 30S ribosomal protein S20 [Candidatus Paceibacterota bacterium]|nr:30S ribosomal protein S20 [Candidatus Paceibacterota bacterium]